MVVIADSAFGVTLLAVRVAAVGKGGRVARIEQDRMVEVLDGAVEFAACAEYHAAIVESRRILGIQLKRLVVIAESAFAVAVLAVRVLSLIHISEPTRPY